LVARSEAFSGAFSARVDRDDNPLSADNVPKGVGRPGVSQGGHAASARRGA
jgi:hypothetical protein